MKNINRRIVIVAALIFTVGLAFGIMKFLIAQKKKPERRPPIEAKRYVKTDTVKYKTIVSPVTATGRLSSTAEVDIVAEASGRIQPGKVPLKKGAVFSKGEILFIIYPDEAELALKARKSQFLNMLANILPDLRIDYPDHEPVFTDFFSSISIDEPLPSLPRVKDEKVRIFLASRNILSEYYGIRKDELQLKRHTVIAPFNGTYTQVNMEVGAFTNMGGRVAQAIHTEELELEVPLEKYDAQWVKIGDKVLVRSAKRELEWTGHVIRKSNFVDENTQSQSIFVQLKNSKNKVLLAGEYLTAYFPGHPVKNAMEIPRNAVFNSNEIFVIEDNRLVKKEIHVIKINERTLLFNGLNENEVLVVQPMINVNEGTMVKVLGEKKDTTLKGPVKRVEQGKMKMNK